MPLGFIGRQVHVHNKVCRVTSCGQSTPASACLVHWAGVGCFGFERGFFARNDPHLQAKWLRKIGEKKGREGIPQRSGEYKNKTENQLVSHRVIVNKVRQAVR